MCAASAGNELSMLRAIEMVQLLIDGSFLDDLVRCTGASSEPASCKGRYEYCIASAVQYGQYR
jgi:hypothetical protein